MLRRRHKNSILENMSSLDQRYKHERLYTCLVRCFYNMHVYVTRSWVKIERLKNTVDFIPELGRFAVGNYSMRSRLPFSNEWLYIKCKFFNVLLDPTRCFFQLMSHAVVCGLDLSAAEEVGPRFDLMQAEEVGPRGWYCGFQQWKGLQRPPTSQGLREESFETFA